VRRGDGTLGYVALRSAADGTAGFTREGIVRIELPDDLKTLGAPAPAEGLEGTGEQPPELDDTAAARLWFWLRVWRGDGSRVDPVKWVALNAMSAEQTEAAGAELLGTGTGQPGQLFALTQRPVAPGLVVRLQVEEGPLWTDWTQRDDLDDSGPADRHFQVDAEAGTLRFGRRWPDLGQRLRVLGYRTCRGAAGNVPALAIAALGPPADAQRHAPAPLVDAAGAGLKLANPFRAEGGADAESLDAALGRVPAELRRNRRAVARDDFAAFALQTPGCEIPRAECLPLFHAPSRTLRPGCVTVVVWPARDPLHPNAPVPDAWLLTQVCRWLDRARLVTTELYVAPPTYRRIAVSLAVKVAPGYGLDGVRDWVSVALRQYLAPLPPFGPAGQGWPLGRRVIARELEGVVMQVQGVEYVQQLRLDTLEDDGKTWASIGVRELADWELPELAALTVVGHTTALPAPGTGITPPPSRPFTPVPVLKSEC
jgi:predicted phage baseplate assembly protein